MLTSYHILGIGLGDAWFYTIATNQWAEIAFTKVYTNRYDFYQGMDSGDSDMSGQGGLANNVPALQNWCNSYSTCAGFNTNGWMKSYIRPSNQWYQFSTVPGQGLYVKNSKLQSIRYQFGASIDDKNVVYFLGGYNSENSK